MLKTSQNPEQASAVNTPTFDAARAVSPQGLSRAPRGRSKSIRERDREGWVMAEKDERKAEERRKKAKGGGGSPEKEETGSPGPAPMGGGDAEVNEAAASRSRREDEATEDE
jgi:hypothetical protein